MSGTERGYPASAGARNCEPPRGVARSPLRPRRAAGLAACVGTKELVASVPHLLRLRTPDRDTVLFPAVSYPTYAMGRSWPLPRRPGSGPGRTGRGTRPRRHRTRGRCARPVALVKLALQPTGDWGSRSGGGLGRSHGVPVFSDECYAEFTWEGPPVRCCSTDPGAWWRCTPSPSAEPGRRPGGFLRRRP